MREVAKMSRLQKWSLNENTMDLSGVFCACLVCGTLRFESQCVNMCSDGLGKRLSLVLRFLVHFLVLRFRGRICPSKAQASMCMLMFFFLLVYT